MISLLNMSNRSRQQRSAGTPDTTMGQRATMVPPAMGANGLPSAANIAAHNVAKKGVEGSSFISNSKAADTGVVPPPPMTSTGVSYSQGSPSGKASL